MRATDHDTCTCWEKINQNSAKETMQNTGSTGRGTVNASNEQEKWQSNVRRVNEMTQDEINLTLKRIVANLQLIQDSPALEQIAQSSHAHPNLMATAADALYHCTQLKLRVRQALDGIVAAELKAIFEEVGWF